MDLLCYRMSGWEPQIRPADAKRAWMDDTPDAYAYRCLPLNIANAHGWEILASSPFEVTWSGSTDKAAVTVRMLAEHKPEHLPVSIFGHGVMTIHMYGLFRTPPGWNLWVGGSPNRPKDAIYPLTGVIETDWTPYTFTMNWKLTRPNHTVRFEAGEPICFVFPVQRGYLDAVDPKFVPMESDPELLAQFTGWKASRDEFHTKMARSQPAATAQTWQKRYYRGVDMDERAPIDDHQAKLRLKPFMAGVPAAMPPADAAVAQPTASLPPGSRSAEPGPSGIDTAAATRALQTIAFDLVSGAAEAPMAARLTQMGVAEPDAKRAVATALAHPLVAEGRRAMHRARKREWLLDAIEKLRRLSPRAERIERRAGMSTGEFFEQHYSSHAPVVLLDEISDWPALSKWTPEYLKSVVGSRVVEYQGGRSRDAQFEVNKLQHRRELPFDQFVDLISRPGAGNDAYLTAYNSANSTQNEEAISLLHRDLGFLEKFLAPVERLPHGQMWIGPAGTVTSLHHDLTNNLIAQFVGRKRVKLIPAADVAKIYNYHHVYSEVPDIDAVDLDRYPALREIRSYDVVLSPGELLFIPIGWWHQVKSLDFSVTITYTNFRWPNDFDRTFPFD